MILLENLRFHVEEEGKGKDHEGKKVNYISHYNSPFCRVDRHQWAYLERQLLITETDLCLMPPSTGHAGPQPATVA